MATLGNIVVSIRKYCVLKVFLVRHQSYKKGAFKLTVVGNVEIRNFFFVYKRSTELTK